ncbi:hypothetical protein [Thiocystis violacea]|uniref:hypothetical protein n=1 Tax=Thiocystis violacea TaxID=13725 RepID=UPI0019075D19|nr:hypothetical protein [Thiocystis violacea]MBK1720321.1 hypothetical protein [Thiocystis violacea]
MRLVIILIVIFWGVGVVWVLAWSSGKSREARLTAAYLLGWPALAVILLLNEPVPPWLAAPVLLGFLPWLMAGPHLSAVIKDPTASRSDEIAGIPRAFWIWGGIGSVLLGLLFGALV